MADGLLRQVLPEIQCVCSPCHFVRLGIAHVFLLGLLKDFWRYWLRPVGSAGNEYVLPTVVRTQMSTKGASIQMTELFGKPYTDIIKYGSRVDAPLRLQLQLQAVS